MPRGSHKYQYRTGSPGNYRYFYRDETGNVHEVAQEKGQSEHAKRLVAGYLSGAHEMSREDMANEVYGHDHAADLRQRINSHIQRMRSSHTVSPKEIHEGKHTHAQLGASSYGKHTGGATAPTPRLEVTEPRRRRPATPPARRRRTPTPAAAPTPAAEPVSTAAPAASDRQNLEQKLKEKYGIDLTGGEAPVAPAKPEERPAAARRSTARVAAATAPSSAPARALASADPDFAASERPIERAVSTSEAGGNPYLERAKEIFGRIKNDLKPERKDAAFHMIEAIKNLSVSGGTFNEAQLKTAYNSRRESFGGIPAFGAAKKHFESATFHTLEEVVQNKPVDIEVERMKRGYAAKQFARLKPFLKGSFASAHPSAPPPMPTFGDLKSWTEHGEKPTWAGRGRIALPKEVFDASAKVDGKPQYPPAWMPVNLMPVWNYVIKKVGSSAYQGRQPAVQGGRIATSSQAGYQEGMTINALRKYVQMRGGPDQLVDIPKSKLSELGLQHADIFKAEGLSDAQLKDIIKHKIIDPVGLIPFLDEELKQKSVKKSVMFVVNKDEPFISRAEIRKGMIDEIKRLKNEKIRFEVPLV